MLAFLRLAAAVLVSSSMCQLVHAGGAWSHGSSPPSYVGEVDAVIVNVSPAVAGPSSGGITRSVGELEPDAINVLLRGMLYHHRPDIVGGINRNAFTASTYKSLNEKVGDLMTVEQIEFDIMGPTKFDCNMAKMIRGRAAERRLGVVHMDFAFEYKSELSVAVHAIRHQGTARGKGTGVNLYKRLSRNGDKRWDMAIQGHLEGPIKIRLTIQAVPTAPYVRLANFAVTDPSELRLKLDDYQLQGVPLGHVIHFAAQQWPLHKMEPALNTALQKALTKKGGWPVGGGIDRTVSVLPEGPERERRWPLRWVPGLRRICD